ncbi:MAG TPA: 6,7-dimethyl-8-ribityllumazine synthase [Vicinamibacterales bacterium]|nr:6,7-dimethyl-8-ribityllumazine synthase [Vicinamibacterales bacterium]
MHILEGGKRTDGQRFAVVVSRYNDFVTRPLLDGALAALAEAGAAPEDVTIAHVPGSFELPVAAQRLAETGRFAAVICLGCIIRGGTPHFEYIASAVSHALASASTATGVPITFGVLTTNTVEEAIERAAPGPANKGREAALSAVEMASLMRTLDSAAERLA